uniref:RNA-directed RNA polymerase L n=1 Tax=Neotermes castaneus phenuivirus 1 TaxID=3133467 RepID=A0AAT9JPV0_9VIRU
MEQARTLLDQLAESLYDTLELDIFQAGVLHVPKEAHLHESSIYIPPMGHLVNIHQHHDTIVWDFIIPEEIQEFITLTSSGRRTDIREKYKIRHEFVAEALASAGTDRPLGQELEMLGDDDDKLTPDIFHRDEHGNVYVLEIGTSRSPNENSLMRTYNEKMFKYEMPIRNRRLNIPVVYCVIIVGIDKVLSNFNLPEQIVNELLTRMKIGVAIEDSAKGKGFSITCDELATQRSIMTEEILSRLGKISPRDPPKSQKITISKEYIDDLQTDPSESDALNSFLTSMESTRELMKEQKKVTQFDLVKEYTKSLPKDEKTRSDLKSVVQLPFLNPKLDRNSTNITSFIMAPGGKGDHLQKIWSFVLMQAHKLPSFKDENVFELLNEALETDAKKISGHEQRRRQQRGEWHRINVKEVLDRDTLKYLRDDGLFAKSVKDRDEIKLRKKEQKRPFDFNTKVKDIDDFLKDTSLFEEKFLNLDSSTEYIADLIQKAESISEGEGTGEKFLARWAKTPLFRACDVISDIGYELAISIKQNTSSNEMILKKLRNYPVYLLIKTTNSQSHMFFSLFIPEGSNLTPMHDTVFRTLHKLTRGYATDFVSVRISKIQNWANASATLLTLASFWSYFYGLDDSLPAYFRENLESRKMLLFTLLVSLEDKAQTEEVITLSRYMYMEVLKGNINMLKPAPFKMLTKFPVCIRSRLCLWSIRKIIQNFSSMVVRPPKRVEPEVGVALEEDEDALPGDEWIGLINCFSGGMLRTATAVVNLMYIGYFKNKNETAEGNVEWKMVDKILEEEFGIDPSERGKYQGETSCDEVPGKKQFNKNSILFGCKLLERRLMRKLGPDWKMVLEAEIGDSLSRHLTHEISTLKASSVCSHGDTQKPADKTAYKNLWRVKVIENISTRLGLTGLNPMLSIDRVLQYIESSSAGVICDLFKKNQHGGLREIYVLTIESRIIQLFVETVSRTICSHFEEETLTHPINKLKILDEHKIRMGKLSRKLNATYADFCSSSDKTRWNQNLVMPAMVIPLIRLTTNRFHNALYRSLNLWANKLILLPPVVLKLLLSKVPLSSPTYMELLSKFWGNKNDKYNSLGIRHQKNRYVNLTTGMMQGILHYTSSLLHLTFLACHRHFSLRYLKSAHPEHKFYMAQVCSSDDSATILTVMTKAETKSIAIEDVRAFFECDVILQSSSIYCNFFCMRESDKSTLSVYDYVEFNSEFLFKNTLAIPIIKFVAAVLNLSESESFVNRFYTMYNLISDLYTHGLPSKNTYYCQIAQAFQHYKSLGSSTNALFSEYFDRIVKYPNPTYGFFLLDSPFCCGLLGFSFSRWMLANHDPTYAERLSILQEGEVTTLPDGGLVSSFSIKHGDSARWHLMMDRIDSGTLDPKYKSTKKDKLRGVLTLDHNKIEDRKERIESNPELFFRHPTNAKELKTKLLIKASMPGVSNSLGKGNPFIQSLALSVYAINTHSFTRTLMKESYDPAKTSHKIRKSTIKHSLLSAIEEYIGFSGRSQTDNEKEALFDQAFPLRNKYEDAIQVIDSYKNATLRRVHRLRVRKTLMVIQPKSSALPVSLLQMCSRWWYGHSVRTSESVYTRCKQEYCLAYPWLSATFEETFKKSPFSSAIELFNFISTQSTRARKVLMHCPSVRSNRFSGQVSQLIRKHFMIGYILQRESSERPEVEMIDKSIASLSLSLLIPIESKRDSSARETMTKIARRYQNVEDLHGLGKREAIVGLISMISRRYVTDMAAVNFIRELRNGTIITFTKEQIRKQRGDKVSWVGDGECIVYCDGIVIKIRLDDDIARMITVKDFTLLRRYPGLMVDVFDQLKCRSSHGVKGEGECVARFNGLRFVAPDGYGTPVMLDSKLEDIFSDPPELYIKTPFSKAKVCYMRGQRELVLMEFRTSFTDVSLYSEQDTGTDFWSCWIDQRPLRSVEALVFLEGVDKFLSQKRQDSELKARYSQWISSTLTNRLKYRKIGLIPSKYADEIPDSDKEFDTEEEEEIEKLLYDMTACGPGGRMEEMFGLFQQGLIEQAETAIEEEQQEMDDPELETIEVGMGQMLQFESKISPFRALLSNYLEDQSAHAIAVTRKEAVNFLYLHPIWDDFINDVVDMDLDFFELLLNGVVSAKNAELSLMMMRILGIRERHKEITVLERFRGKKAKMTSDDVFLELGGHMEDVDRDQETRTMPTPSESPHEVPRKEPETLQPKEECEIAKDTSQDKKKRKKRKK